MGSKEAASSTPAKPSRHLSRLTVDADVYPMIQRVSETEGVNMRAALNRLVRRHVEWQTTSERLNFVAVSADVLSRIMGYLTEDEARELGKFSAREMVERWKPVGRKDFEKMLEMIAYQGALTRRFIVETVKKGSSVTVIMRHSLGLKWSFYFEETVRALLAGLQGRGVGRFRLESSENQVFGEVTVR